ncbi:MAG: CPBP family intramembrane metalloprotease [Verrucomicrobiae bacterium]|nr:CPBP family intramembrane metalloprotease [Verrucomicrobiae bacterium]
MRPLRAVLIYVAAVLLCGALVAPCVYQFAQAVSETFPGLASQPFHRFVNRTMLVAALIGLWPLLRATGLNSPAALGLAGHPRPLAMICSGAALGSGTVLAVASLALVTGARTLEPSLAGTAWVLKLAGITATAAVVAVLEETLFRGALFGALRKVWHWWFALVVSSLLFATAHFVQSGRVQGPIGWLSGFVVLGHMFEGFLQFKRIAPMLINLWLVGAILCLGFQRTGSLHFPIGLHAGWVFMLKLYGWLTVQAEHANTALWGTRKLVDGWVVLPVLIVLYIVLVRVLRPQVQKKTYGQIVF